MRPDLSQCKVPDWVNWLAQDADGTWWGYEVEPHQHEKGWYENELGRFIRLASTSGGHQWRQNLIKCSDYH